MIRNVVYPKSRILGEPRFEGETIEQKMERVLVNKEPIKDGAPALYTERKDGVIPMFNIRTDKWELLADAKHKFAEGIEARRAERHKPKSDENEQDNDNKVDTKVVNLNTGGESGA